MGVPGTGYWGLGTGKKIVLSAELGVPGRWRVESRLWKVGRG